MIKIVKNPDERKKEIVEAARKLFFENDYEKTTMQDIIDHLEIAKGTIYHYFKSKEELLDAVVEVTVDEYIANLIPLVDAKSGSALDRMRMIIEAGNISEEDELLKQLHKPGNVALHTRLLALTFTRLAPLIANVIEQGCKENIFQTEHPLESAELLLAGIQFLTDSGIYPWSQETLSRRSKAIPTLIEAQLSAPKGSFSFLNR